MSSVVFTDPEPTAEGVRRDNAPMSSVAHLHLHVKINRSGEEIFRITPERYAAAEVRNPDAAALITTTIGWDLDDFDSQMATAAGLITWDLPTEDLATRAPNLRWIHIIGAGVEHLQPLDWLPDGVTLTNNRGVHADKAGEYGLMALLMLNNRIPSLVSAQRRHEYVELFTSTIVGKTLLVVGAGNMGQAVARKARAHGLRTVGIRRTPQPTTGFDSIHGPDQLDELLPSADFVLITTPATPETRGLINSTRLSMMKPDAGLINMGRAPVIDYEALARSLEDGTISGAVLDVFEPEPLPSTSPLWEVPNLIMTPHMSSDDAVWYTPLTLDLVFENVVRLIADEPLLNTVDPEQGY